MKVVVISGSPRKDGKTQIIMKYAYEYVRKTNPDTSLINLADEDVECYRGYDVEYNDSTKNARDRIMNADVWLIGTPIYNSFFSGAIKNLFEYVSYKKTEGKVAGVVILASGNIGFTYVQSLMNQLLSYFRVITNPKTVFITADSISDNSEIDNDTKIRIDEMVDRTLELAKKIA